MARNHEKAASMLHRFRASQMAEQGISPGTDGRRPRNPSSVFSLQVCEKWRQQITADLSRKVTKIHEYGMSDYEVRDLNDEINKVIKEKLHWEDQIIRLGGPNYKRFGSKVHDEEGRELPGQRGYRYFGRAKELPGVKELFDMQLEAMNSHKDPKFKQMEKLQASLGPDYYGDFDEEDGKLLQFERAKTKQEVGDWQLLDEEQARSLTPSSVVKSKSGDNKAIEGSQVPDEPPLYAPLVPSQSQVEEYLMDRRKEALLTTFVGS